MPFKRPSHQSATSPNNLDDPSDNDSLHHPRRTKYARIDTKKSKDDITDTTEKTDKTYERIRFDTESDPFKSSSSASFTCSSSNSSPRSRQASVTSSSSTIARRMSISSPYEPLPPDEFIAPSGLKLSSIVAPQLLSHYLGSLHVDLNVNKLKWDIIAVPCPSSPCPTPAMLSVGAKKRVSTLPDIFFATLTMPDKCPVRSATSTPPGHRSKQLAKQSAAFHMLIALHAAGEIDDEFQPTPSAPATRTKLTASKPPSGPESPQSIVASGALSPKAKRKYKENSPMEQFIAKTHKSLPLKKVGSTGIIGMLDYDYLPRSTFWDLKSDEATLSSQSSPIPTPLWYPIILTLFFDEPYTSRGDGCRPLLLLTKSPLPMFGSSTSIDVDVSTTEVRAHFTLTQCRFEGNGQLDQSQLYNAFRWDRRIFRALINKAIDSTLSSTGTLLLPLVASFTFPDLSTNLQTLPILSISDIDWSEVGEADKSFTPLDVVHLDVLRSQVADGMITGPGEFTRRWFVTNIRTDLNPLSPHPEHPEMTIEEYVLTPGKGEFRYGDITSVQDTKQPILEGQHVVGLGSGGYILAKPTAKRRDRLIIPELYRLHVISASVYRTASAFPSLLATLDDMLVADELNAKFFNHKLKSSLALEAITAPSCMSKLRAGVKSYQRLEILGDTLLKLVVTVEVYIADHTAAIKGRINASLAKTLGEGAMTHTRDLIVSNRALQKFFVDSGMVPYIRHLVPKNKDFSPPGWELEDICEGDKKTTEKLGDKTVADVAEALIAAAYLSSDKSVQGAVEAMHAIGIPTTLKDWSNVGSSLVLPPTTDSGRENRLNILGYTFKNTDEGRKALNLAASPESQMSFRRYEFLGDAVLDYLAMEELWMDHPHLGPAPLTRMKHSRVANNAFAAFMVHSGLSAHLINLDENTIPSLQAFTEAMCEAKKLADESSKLGGENEIEYWSDTPVRKWLGDTLEAIFGAIFVDSGFNLAVVQNIYRTHYKPFIESYAAGPEEDAKHPKSIFLEMMDKYGCKTWHISKRRENLNGTGNFISDVYIHQDLIASASAEGPTIATRRVCEIVNKKIGKDNIVSMLCDCPKRGAKK